LIRYLKARWSSEDGYRDFLVVAFPLVLSSATWSIQHFLDRVFLTWYSTEALAASLPAAMTSFIVMAFFLGTAGYVNTFVAQYSGAERPHRVGPSLWQGGYLAVLSGVAGLGCAAGSETLFDFIGHSAAVRGDEIAYFRVLCYGVFPLVLSSSLSCFYSGRGKTWMILAVSTVSMIANIILNYGLIFGNWGLPEMGIRGAGWATNLATLLGAALYLGLLMQKRYRRDFATLSGWRFDRELFARLMRFGAPNGISFMLDISALSLFILIMGRVGTLELTATNLAFNINGLAFMPLIGGGIAVSTLVGQHLGQNRPLAAERATWSGVHLAAAYMGIMSLAYFLVPRLFLVAYGVGASDDFEAAEDLAVILLRFVAIYCLFDTFFIILTAALKGAGDTRFVMYVSVIIGLVLLVIPSFISQRYFDGGVYELWIFLCAYVMTGGIVFYFRFRGGKWKSMRVIEDAPPPAPQIEEPRMMGEATTGL
jgi:MATE family multidrug resistance protein